MMVPKKKTPYNEQEGVAITKGDLETIDEIILNAEKVLAYDRGTKNPLDAITTIVNLLGKKYDSLSSEKGALEICVKYDKSKTPYQIEKVRNTIQECLELLFETELELNTLKYRMEGKR